MSKSLFVNALGLVSLVLLMQRGDATTFTVGGSKGWSVPSDNGNVYNQWAERMRFQVGDSILFKYPSSSDSVLQVSKEDYSSCTTTSPIAKYTDGNTEFKFSKSGPYYFISGNKDNCNKNEKLAVVVMADRSGKSSPPSPSASAPSPAPTTSHDQQPPIASPPMDNGTTLAPAGGLGPSADLAPSAESNPPKKNGAASTVMSFVGAFGAFVGSSVILAF
ncbi:early nodulin-like protein 1 [Chenopodium quinoa]|uniref:Phytocyanin domain-containing protein n=1 Tax=Chenopodium quinoa TaxID=63459 RepID=A0A803NB23_CHEQI|nr:early nodulin-like protein 1 [Chenopodium quinoa]